MTLISTFQADATVRCPDPADELPPNFFDSMKGDVQVRHHHFYQYFCHDLCVLSHLQDLVPILIFLRSLIAFPRSFAALHPMK